MRIILPLALLVLGLKLPGSAETRKPRLPKESYLGRGGAEGRGPYYSVPPKLLNGKEIKKLLRASYPKTEKKDAMVYVNLYIGVDGKIDEAEAASPDQAFVPSALKVARKMRFSPALGSAGPVPSKYTIIIEFRPKPQSSRISLMP